MPEELHETLIKSLLTGATAYQRAGKPGREFQQRILLKHLENILTPKKWVPTTKEEALEFERAKLRFKKEAKEPTKREAKVSQSRLLREFLGQKYAELKKKEGFLDRWSPTWSQAEVIREQLAGRGRYKKSKELFRAIGVTNQDFYNWAKEFEPEEARRAFPARRPLLRRR